MLINVNNDIPISGNKINLNLNNEYQQYNIKSPILTSIYLDICSYILTRTLFSRSIRRYLLDSNDIVDLRDIASQIIYPPMSYPMKRLKSNNNINNTSNSDPDDIFTNILRYGYNHHHHEHHHHHVDYDHDQPVINDAPKNKVVTTKEKVKVNRLVFPRSIIEYHEFYKNIIRLCNSYRGDDDDGSNDEISDSKHDGSDVHDSSSTNDYCRNDNDHHHYLPSTVMKATLNTIAQWKAEEFHIFSSIRPEDVMEQAILSDKRWIDGKLIWYF